MWRGTGAGKSGELKREKAGGGGGGGGGIGKHFATLCNVLKWENRKDARTIVESQKPEERAVSWCSDHQMIDVKQKAQKTN